ncbi:hypothetical protein KY290_031633 [Solanum tuberosum]|uniref:Uncharacterized protein n=1 Tax=Solanum tuberosum TaxID=4113 RepID=A0ABQ7U9T8_SOLTU|nr:hypothetical protein KY290_031633 [Solanum tuberosum]
MAPRGSVGLESLKAQCLGVLGWVGDLEARRLGAWAIGGTLRHDASSLGHGASGFPGVVVGGGGAASRHSALGFEGSGGGGRASRHDTSKVGGGGPQGTTPRGSRGGMRRPQGTMPRGSRGGGGLKALCLGA